MQVDRKANIEQEEDIVQAKTLAQVDREASVGKKADILRAVLLAQADREASMEQEEDIVHARALAHVDRKASLDRRPAGNETEATTPASLWARSARKLAAALQLLRQPRAHPLPSKGPTRC